MNRKIWAGSRNNHVGFADSETALIDQGYANPTSFTVNGEVSDLKLISQEQTAQSGSGAVTA